MILSVPTPHVPAEFLPAEFLTVILPRLEPDQQDICFRSKVIKTGFMEAQDVTDGITAGTS